MAADGSGSPEALTKSNSNQGATSWSPDGRTLLFYDTGGGYDIFALTPGSPPAPLLNTPRAREQGPTFSPDGRWIAYSSDETGREEIYIAPYPGRGSRITVSTEGGRSPLWSSDGRELVYRNGDQMMAVALDLQPTLRVGAARLLFRGNYVREFQGQGVPNYDMTPDGRRFLLLAPVPGPEENAQPQIVVVEHWLEELKRLVPTN
jgi:serine/threonine-protein kinase